MGQSWGAFGVCWMSSIRALSFFWALDSHKGSLLLVVSSTVSLVPFLHIRAGQSAVGKGNGIIRQNLTSRLGSAPDLLCNLDK